MKTAAFVALLPTLAFASLFTRDTYSGLITLSALGSGTPVQNLTAIGYSTSNQNEITASDGHFYIGKPTASIPCPTRLSKLPTNITAIVVVNTRAHMASRGADQRIFVNRTDSALSYEIVHSSTTETKSNTLKGFIYKPNGPGETVGSLSFNASKPAFKDFWACQLPGQPEVSQIFLSDTPQKLDSSRACTRIEVATASYRHRGRKFAAWLY